LFDESGENDLSLRAIYEEPDKQGNRKTLSLVFTCIYVQPARKGLASDSEELPTSYIVMTNNVLDPSAILALLPSLLPTESKSLASPQDGIAALLHASLSALSFRLTAVGDSPPQPSLSNNTLPVNWNENGPGHYTFKYRHEQSSLEFIINVAKLGNRTVINAIALKVSTLLRWPSNLISL
jgi:hypothetical protein